MRNRPKLADWLKEIPTWLKAAFGLIATIATFVIAFRENWRLYTTIAVFLVLGYGLVVSLHVILARGKSRSRKNQTTYRYEKYRPLALIGLTVVLLSFVGLIAFGWTRQFALDGILGTQTPTLISTPIPTSTPTPIPQLPSADVLIAEFDARHATRTLDVAHRLEDELEKVLESSEMRDVNVQLISRPVANEAEAQSTVNDTGSKVVIWGWYDDEGIQVKVFLSGEGKPGRELSGTDEIPLTPTAEAESELTYVVKEILPENVSFLSLFVIGHLKYLSNDYEAGYRAFDAAMNNLPETVFIENKAILHFFQARKMDTAGADLTDVLCAYAKAIELDPDFAEPYNNLAVVIGRLYSKNSLTRPIPGGTYFCLRDAGLSSTQDLYPPALYKRALEINPSLTVTEYNLNAFWWKNKPSGLDASIFKEIQKKDPSIAGTYMILGIELERAGKYEESINMYESGRRAVPADPFLHFNLGNLYLRQQKDEIKAESEFRAVLLHEPNHREAHLALGNLLYGQKKFEEASQEFNAILQAAESNPSVVKDRVDWDARVLRSGIRFHQNETMQAIGELESIVQNTHENSFERFLLGILYQSARKDAEAIESFRTAYSLSSNANQTSRETWDDVLSRCGWTPSSNTFQDWAMKELPEEDCLPSDENQRIDAIYDLFHAYVFSETINTTAESGGGGGGKETGLGP